MIIDYILFNFKQKLSVFWFCCKCLKQIALSDWGGGGGHSKPMITFLNTFNFCFTEKKNDTGGRFPPLYPINCMLFIVFNWKTLECAVFHSFQPTNKTLKIKSPTIIHPFVMSDNQKLPCVHKAIAFFSRSWIHTGWEKPTARGAGASRDARDVTKDQHPGHRDWVMWMPTHFTDGLYRRRATEVSFICAWCSLSLLSWMRQFLVPWKQAEMG